MELFNIITFLVVLSSIFGYINIRFLKMPATIGLMTLSIVFSAITILAYYIHPQLFQYAVNAVEQINFSSVLLNVMLSFLLFAGALHTDTSLLRKESRTIILFSVVGVIISTVIVAALIFGIVSLMGYRLDFIYCLLFGALISPTDPIAVLGILTKAGVPKRIETNIVGESLFNDGIGVVVFIIILEIIQQGVETVSFADVVLLFIREAFGGLAFGFVIGYVTYILLKSIDHYETEVMITIAMVMGGYYLANLLHISGPLAMVVAGLFSESRIKNAMSSTTTLYIDKFWELIDAIMNAILFVLIGLRLMVLDYKNTYLLLGILAIPVVLVARYLSISLPLFLSKRQRLFNKKDRLLMVWGGLRGGLSIAMALSLSQNMHRDLLVFITYIVVLFSILVQGLTVGKFARRLYKTE